MSWPSLILLAEWLIRIGLSVRVISKRNNVSESLAWMGLILIFPVGGAALYLWFGEKPLGKRRMDWQARIAPTVARWVQDVYPRSIHSWPHDHDEERALSTMVRTVAGVPALSGNQLTLLDSADKLIESLLADVQTAKRWCYLEFYIWEEGGFTNRLVDELIAAARRGVDCRVLVDDVGSRSFLKSQSVRRLRQGGVKVHSALRVGIVRSWFLRLDLRLHRKIIVIDERIGYTGSHNMADPKFFRAHAGVGQWVDAMIRLDGEASEALLATFLSDWHVEAHEGIEQLQHALESTPECTSEAAIVQVIPTGPTFNRDSARQIIINTLFTAKRQLVLTTPYYIPDEGLQMALISAANRGVDVTLIVPKKVDSRLVQWASNPYQVDLADAGVRVLLYEGGLLHTKSITVDDRISLFGSLNLDLRSLHLNFEITLAVYDRPFTRLLRRLQQSYMRNSTEKRILQRPSFGQRLLENSVRLLAPLL